MMIPTIPNINPMVPGLRASPPAPMGRWRKREKVAVRERARKVKMA